VAPAGGTSWPSRAFTFLSRLTQIAPPSTRFVFLGAGFRLGLPSHPASRRSYLRLGVSTTSSSRGLSPPKRSPMPGVLKGGAAARHGWRARTRGHAPDWRAFSTAWRRPSAPWPSGARPGSRHGRRGHRRCWTAACPAVDGRVGGEPRRWGGGPARCLSVGGRTVRAAAAAPFPRTRRQPVPAVTHHQLTKPKPKRPGAVLPAPGRPLDSDLPRQEPAPAGDGTNRGA
jgi:hypothetical protein